jgi:hypothetical protein
LTFSFDEQMNSFTPSMFVCLFYSLSAPAYLVIDNQVLTQSVAIWSDPDDIAGWGLSPRGLKLKGYDAIKPDWFSKMIFVALNHNFGRD